MLVAFHPVAHDALFGGFEALVAVGGQGRNVKEFHDGGAFVSAPQARPSFHTPSGITIFSGIISDNIPATNSEPSVLCVPFCLYC